MRHRSALSAALLTALLPALLAAQAPPAPKRTLVRAGRLIDGLADSARRDQGILIEGERIVEVGPWAAVQAKAGAAERVDLSAMTVLPGLIDAHTHVMLNGDITAQDYDDQLLKESIPYRAIRATANVRAALWNGFTALRDLETEGAMYADVDVKTAIARGVIPGPRMFVATRAFAPTGMYPLSGYSWELRVPEGVQIVDGAEQIRKAVREQVKYGADWIKVYADRRYFVADDGKLHSWTNWTDEEFKAFVEEAHRLGRTRGRLAEDGGAREGRVRRGAPARDARPHRQRHRRGRLRLEREPGEGARLHGQVRDDADAGDRGRDVGRRVAPRRHQGSRRGGTGALRGPGGRGRRPAPGHHRAAAGGVRDERGRGVPTYSPPMNGYPYSVGGTKVSLIARGETQRTRLSTEPALSLVPLARAPPNGCCPTTAPVGLSLT